MIKHVRTYHLSEEELVRFRVIMRLLRFPEKEGRDRVAYVIQEDLLYVVVWDGTEDQEFIATLESYGFTHD
jgi:hypothetical protein